MVSLRARFSLVRFPIRLLFALLPLYIFLALGMVPTTAPPTLAGTAPNGATPPCCGELTACSTTFCSIDVNDTARIDYSLTIDNPCNVLINVTVTDYLEVTLDDHPPLDNWYTVLTKTPVSESLPPGQTIHADVFREVSFVPEEVYYRIHTTVVEPNSCQVYEFYSVEDFICTHTQDAPDRPIGDCDLILCNGPMNVEVRTCNPSLANPCGSPVNPATGNFSYTATDIAVPGRGPALLFSRTYNSDAAVNPDETGLMGPGWTHSYNMRVVTRTTEYWVYQENGTVAPFPIATPGAGYPRVLAEFRRNPDQTFTLTRTHSLDRFYFNANGKLTRITDRQGYDTDLTYVNGRLDHVTEPDGRTLEFSYYSTSGLLRWVYDPVGRAVEFSYNAAGELTGAEDLEDNITTFNYFGDHRMEWVRDPRGGQLTNAYHLGRVVHQTDPLTRTMGFIYQPCGNGCIQTTITNTLSAPTVLTHQCNMLLRQDRMLEPGRVATWRYTYDTGYPMGVARVEDPNSHVLTNTWDTRGNRLATYDPLGNPTRYAYSITNDLLVITNALGLTTTFGYNTDGQVRRVTRPWVEDGTSVTTWFDYDTNNPDDLESVSDPLGHAWTYDYDGYGNVINSSDPLGHTTVYTYNALLGWLLEVQPPTLVTATLYTYNDYGDVRTVTDALGYTTVYTYDGNRNLIHVTDANRHTITNTYNLDNEVTRATRHDGTYSEVFRGVVSQTNPLRQPLRLAYDALDRPVAVTDALTRTTVYTYDLAGNLTVMTDALGLRTDYGYDDTDQLLTINYSDPGTRDVTYTYDALGRRDTMDDGTNSSGNAVTEYAYDSLNRMIAVTDAWGVEVGYAYDRAGKLITMTYPPLGSSGAQNVGYTYNAAGQMETMTDWLNGTTGFEYDANGNLETLTRPSLLGQPGGGGQTSIGYDAVDRIASMSGFSYANQPLAALSYTRDPVGLLRTADHTGVGAGFHAYEYDTLNRLQGEDITPSGHISRTWEFDSGSQIARTTITDTNLNVFTSERTYDNGNQLQVWQEWTQPVPQPQVYWEYDYDANGNRLNQSEKYDDRTTDYTYDQANRLIEYDPHNSAVYTYAYNGDGLRVSKTRPAGPGFSTEYFTWDVAGGLPRLLQDGTARYLYGPGGRLLEQIRAEDEAVFYYEQDQLGSVVRLSPAAGGGAVTYIYDAYGNRTLDDPNRLELHNVFGYAGEYTDPESGLVYLRARYYDPASQQFLTRDPLTAFSETPYGYAGGSPVNATDPSGLCDCLLDLAFIVGDLADIGANGLNWENGLALGADVGSLAVPVFTGGGVIVRGAMHADDAVDVVLHGSEVVGAPRVLIDSSVVPLLSQDPTLGGRLAAGEQAIVSYVTRPELRNAVAETARTGKGLRGVPRILDTLPVLTKRPSLNTRINLRGRLNRVTGRFGDGIIGAQALEFGLPLITNDRELARIVRELGGILR